MNFFDMYENVKTKERSVVTTQKEQKTAKDPEVETEKSMEVETENENENESEE